MPIKLFRNGKANKKLYFLYTFNVHTVIKPINEKHEMTKYMDGSKQKPDLGSHKS